MKRSIHRYGIRSSIFFSLLMVLAASRCTSLREVRIIGTNFSEEVTLSQNLVFTFNKNIWPETGLEEWDSTGYLTFEPAIRGRFKWTAPNELVFSPATPLQPATPYKATLTSQVLGKGTEFTISQTPLLFHTPYLHLTSTNSWWTVSPEDALPEARLELKFNYPVNARQVSDHLTIVNDEHPVDFRLLTSDDPAAVLLALPVRSGTSGGPLPLTVQLDKGIAMESGLYATKEPVTRVTSIPSPLQLTVTQVTTGYENNKGYVRVYTSQELQPSAIDEGYSVLPAATVTTEKTPNGFIVRGSFLETETYVFKLNSRLKGLLGPALSEEESHDLFFGKMPPGIQFVHTRAQYLTPRGNKNIGIQITNIPKVQVKVVKIYENNILHYLHQGRYQNYSETDGQWGPDGTYNYSDDYQGLYSDVMVNKVIATADLATENGVSALNLALPDAGGVAAKGIYLVSVSSSEEMYLRQHKLVSLSDIGLIVKQGKDELWVFANSIYTAEPLANVEIALISSNNQLVYTLKTDSKGVAHASQLQEKAPGFRIAMVTARTGNDFNYLYFNDTRIETSRFEVEGSRSNSSGLQAFIYGERDIYRPGETLQFNTVLRSETWETPENVPIKLKLITPNGQTWRTWRKNTNKQGAAAIAATIEEASLTGTYTLEVYNGNDVLLASQNVSVEEFIPDRINVTLSGGEQAYTTGETVALTAAAVNLFGPPAANRTYEMESFLKRKQFYAKDFPRFSFEIPAETRFEKIKKQGVTDADGLAKEEFPLAATYQDIGLLEGKIFVTVFDENNRAVNRLHTFDVFTQPVFYGLHLPDRYVAVNAPVPVEVIGVDTKGNLKKNTSAQVEVLRIQYQTVVENKNGQLRYTSARKEQQVYQNTLKLSNGQGNFRYTPTVSGEYEIRIRRPGATHYTVQRFYAYGYGYTQYSSFEVSTEGSVLMETDKPRYSPRDKARILFKTPFDGTLLVTVERNRVLEYHTLKTDKKAASLTLNITGEHLPNAYVTATLIRPMEAGQLPLTVAHGFLPIFTEASDRKLDVKITAAASSRSKTKQSIRVKTAPGAQVTLALVDEGILQIKNFQTPDIHGYFYQKRALEVDSYNLYAFLFPELKFGAGSSYGGDGFQLERRINPLSNGRTDLVRFWSGILETNAGGEAHFDVELPQFSGDLRIMAVAYKDKAFGSASQHMKVADPVVISTGVPRFMSPGDDLLLPVTLTNTTKQATPANVELQLEGKLSLVGAATTSLTLEAGKEQQVFFRIKAADGIGASRIAVKVRAFSENFSQENALNVRPASPLLKTTHAGIIAGGQSGTVSLAHTFIPGTSRSQLILSRSPLVRDAGKALSALLGYPHGCLEQSISRAFPQLYFAELSKAMASPVYLVRDGDSDFNPVTNVQQAIRKAESQQLFNGAFALWPGSSRQDWWLTAYTLHFLYEAQLAGFDITPGNFSKAIDYLTAQTGIRSTEEIPVRTADHTQIRKIVAPREALYSLYVLAAVGAPNRPAMSYYKQHPELLVNETRYLLAGAYQLTGDSESYAELLPGAFSPQYDDHPGSYASSLSDLGLVLNTLLETDPQHLQIPVLARQLSQAVASAPYLSTQEAAFAVLSLGKIAQKTAASTVTAEVLAQGKKLGQFLGEELRLSENLPAGSLQIKTDGSGSLYWYSETEGMNAAGIYTEEDAGLKVRRYYLDRDGKPVTAFRQNDLVVVKITLATTNGLTVPNVVITDLLPAGFEIENPRLTENRKMAWVKGSTTPDYFDIRDDRIHYFTTAGPTQKTFYYQARITAKGNFVAGPVAADAMYQGMYKSYWGGRKLEVK